MIRRALVLGGIGSLALVGAALWHFGPTTAPFVRDQAGARWLVADTERWVGTYRIQPRSVGFRTTFRIDAPTPPVVLSLRAVERAAVALDGETIYTEPNPDPRGRVVRRVPLGSLREGEHELAIYVLASANPPLLWVRSDPPLVATGSNWQFSSGPQDAWRAARLATDGPDPFPLSREFPHAGRAFLRVLPVVLALFLIVLWIEGRGGPTPTPEQLRWALIAVWGGLAANNLLRVPAEVGMDLSAHLAYVVYLVDHGAIPIATQGDEMMQAPLAYLLFAPLFLGLSAFVDTDRVIQGMRILPMICGAAQVELSYRAVRHVHSDRADLQRAALLVGGLLPVNLYLAHAVANEPVVALFGGGVAVAALGIATRAGSPSRSQLIGAGTLLGLALLSKVTAVLLAPALVGAVALRAYRPDRSIARALRASALVVGCAALVAGWYYARNWALLGTPFLGTWRPGVVGAWWQEPGYRSASQYLQFGEALVHPIYAAVVGLWDGLYATLWLDGGLSGAISRAGAPPWNESPLLASAWLALVPSFAIAAGGLRSLRRAGARPQVRLAERLAAGTVALYLAAILYLHLTVPFYCIGKASYLAATTPFLAMLAASGLAELGRVRWARAGISAALVCWAANAIATYWVLSPAH
jgi:hypothetical protein